MPVVGQIAVLQLTVFASSCLDTSSPDGKPLFEGGGGGGGGGGVDC